MNKIATLLIMLTILLTACGTTDDAAVVEEEAAVAPADIPTTENPESNNSDESEEEVVPTAASPDDSANDTAPPTANTSFDDLAAGTHDLNISGAISSDGSYTGEEVTVSYEPFNSANTTGQHELEIYADISPTELTDETFVIVYVRFPADIAPGTYDIQARDRNAPELVQGFVAFDNIAVADFDESVSGTLEIVEIGEQITAVFNFTAHWGRDETLTVDVSGRVNQVPFNYRSETTLTLSGLVAREFTTLASFEDETMTYTRQYFLDDFTNEFRWDSSFRDNDFAYMAEVIFYLPADIQPGTYEVAYAPPGNQQVPDGFQVGTRLTYENGSESIDFSADAISGTITITVDERNYANATFSITGTDSETGESLTANGTFQYFENQFGNQ